MKKFLIFTFISFLLLCFSIYFFVFEKYYSLWRLVIIFGGSFFIGISMIFEIRKQYFCNNCNKIMCKYTVLENKEIQCGHCKTVGNYVKFRVKFPGQ